MLCDGFFGTLITNVLSPTGIDAAYPRRLDDAVLPHIGGKASEQIPDDLPRERNCRNNQGQPLNTFLGSNASPSIRSHPAETREQRIQSGA